MNPFCDGSQITIARKQECVVYTPRDLQGVDGKLDTDIAFYSSAAFAVIVLFGWLRPNRLAVVIEPIYQRSDTAELVVVPHDGIEV